MSIRNPTMLMKSNHRVKQMEIQKDTQIGQDSAWVHEVVNHPDHPAWEDAVMSKRVTSTSSSLSSVPGNPHI